MTNRPEDWDRLENRSRYGSYPNKKAVLYTRMLRLCPSNPHPYLALALQLLKQRKYEKAKQKFKKSIQISPKMLSLYNDWLEALYFERQFEEIILFVEKYPDKFSVPENIQNTLGMCFLHLGDFDKAIKCFENVTRENADFEMAYFNWTLALYLQGKKEEALGVFTRRGVKEVYDLYRTIYEREISLLKEDLKREDVKESEDLVNMKIKGFEYVLGLMVENAEQR